MLIFAHRGASATQRENSRAAFTAAVAAGADGIELDVRRTVDDHLVVHHDARFADGRLVAGCRADQVPSHVPALAEALAVCAPCVVNVEIKDLPGELEFDPSRRTARLTAAALDDPPSAVLVSSFDPAALAVVRAVTPELDLGVLAARSEADALLDRATALGAVAVHPADGDTDETLVAAAHRAGFRVHVWTVNDPDRLRELAELGVDAAITDDPAAARAALAR